MVADFARQGWQRFDAEPDVANWAAAALASLRGRALADLRLGGTWDVGLEALPNDAAGTVGGVPLRGRAIAAARAPLCQALKQRYSMISAQAAPEVISA